ncbi:MAG: hypothetical protein PVG65_01550 [Candidatus Thorarchaeota archaeon]|jgi:hypothetical protein
MRPKTQLIAMRIEEDVLEKIDKLVEKANPRSWDVFGGRANRSYMIHLLLKEALEQRKKKQQRVSSRKK